MPLNTASVTSTVAVAVEPDAVCVAVMVAVPVAIALTRPLAPTVMTDGSDETKVELAVTSPLVALLKCPLTTSCCDPPGARTTDAGSTAMETTRSGATVTCADAVLPESA